MLWLFNQINYILKRQCLTSLCSSHQKRHVFIDGMKLQKFNLLEGIKILDLTRIVAGPYCTMLMGDLGADILKIEQPNLGDESRRWGPFLKNSNESSYFIALNRNKKSICVNLKSSAGQSIVKDLARNCDILIENYVPGKLERLGLGYDNLMEIAPQLVYCSITGFGKTGPYKLRSGMDVIAASIGGLLHITGPKDGEPCKNGIAMTDIATGLYAYGSIMAALLQRQITGKGQKIDCNLLSTQVACLINVGSRYLNANQDTQRLGTAHPNIVPYQTFPTADSFITIGAVSNDQFAKLCQKLSLEHLIVDDRFLSNSLRVQNREVLLKILKDKLVSKTTKQWLTIFEGVSFSYGQVNSIAEVFEDEHVKHSGIVKEIEMNHENVDSIIKVVGPAVQFSACENKVRLPPPRLGQHTVEVLTEFLNYNNDQLEQLIKNGDIQ